MRTTPWLLCAAALAVTAQAQTARPENNTAQVIPGQIVVDEATGVVQNMKQQAELAGVMDHAKAVLIVPRYGADPARLVDRAERTSPSANTSLASDSMVKHGSPGVFLLHTAGWSAPAFFSVGKVPMSDTDNASNGAQNRQRGMPLVMMFMSARAAKQMQGSNKVSLAGLNVSHYSDRPRGSLSDADVVVWTPHAMPHDGDLAAAQIHYDDAASNAYYMNQATESQILSSNVSTARATRLQGALAQRVASSK
jgi:hypothetical protein